ncbi:site-specific integrase [Luteimonas sp. MC1782]|uniref:tyrosine-type recombinase/integrase n=1 Tax=Luteimonas sp. MC1782 TaxID=2760305 RepID=UPI0016030654|nr:site-specific integrase [Luteimonas sp. MC1782]MBB1471833.1 site-specific integrase [Luteimonas sp. MC1782]
MATIEKRTASDGTTSYRVKVRLRGERPRSRTFQRITDAKAWAAKVESDLGHGVYVPTTADRRTSLGDLIDKYVTDYLPVKANNRDHAGQVAMLSWWREEYGFVTLDKLQPAVFSEARGKLAKRLNRYGNPLSGATINRYLAAISAVCKWAWKELHALQSNPVLSVSKAAESEGVIRFLSDDERKALFKACNAHPNRNIRTAVTLALATGARYSNIRNLRWPDVDMDSWRLCFRETKTGQPRYVPVVGVAQNALRDQFNADPTKDGWVFKGQGDKTPADLEKHWREVRDAADLQDFRFHDLRHTTASYLTQSGAGLAQVADALGHRTLVMAKRYSHQSGEHVRATLATIADRLASVEDDE